MSIQIGIFFCKFYTVKEYSLLMIFKSGEHYCNIILSETAGINMKKIFLIIVSVVIAMSLIGCNILSAESKYYGTWEVASVEKGDSTFTIEELEAMGDYSLSNFKIVIKEGGSAYISEEGNDAVVDWSLEGDVLKIGVRECQITDDTISIENNGNAINLKKTSDEQTITGEEEQTTIAESATESESVADTATNTSSEMPAWKEFLADYEAWVDNYVEIAKKYSENPTDMSILSDYTNMMTELNEWQTKATDVQNELQEASPAEAAEYAAEVARIAAKIAEAAY